MSREIARTLPDGDTDYDGEEENEDTDDTYQRYWEISTMFW